MSNPTTAPLSHRVSYPRFLWRALSAATSGSRAFYAWMVALTAVFCVGANAWAHQVTGGMVQTNMTDHVSWGLYIANFTFLVGVAAGGVMMVIPAYLYKDRRMRDVVIIGEMLAIAAIVACLLFVVADLGKPGRGWHMLPGIGRFNFPISMLTWDVLVLNGYLLINLHVVGYLLYTRFLGKQPNPKWYKPFVLLSIFWAISIHTVTAFLYCGLGGRPFWNSALLAPRFLASAFVSGPAFIVITLLVLHRFAGIRKHEGPIDTLVKIMRVTLLINLLMVASEIFTEFYTGGAHTSSARYLFFGHGEASALVPWIWTAVVCSVLAAVLFLTPHLAKRRGLLLFACVLAFSGAWIEKGMGLIVPGFVPSTLHEYVEYTPSHLEWRVAAGIIAFGLLLFSALLKVAIPVMRGTMRIDTPPADVADA